MNPRRTLQGSALLVTLVLLTLLALGALALARNTEYLGLLGGNIASRDTALQASEVGSSQAFAALKALTNVEADAGPWYYASRRGDDAAGLPAGIDWTALPPVAVGADQVRYVVERLCIGPLPVSDPAARCERQALASQGSAKAGAEPFTPSSVQQYRITVSVSGPRATQSFVQVMAQR